jgi:hypothetical protein
MTPSAGRPGWLTAFLLFCVIFGGWLRIWQINSQSLWFDEVFSRNVAVNSALGSILTDGVAGDVHPPLYFALLNLWAKFTGDSAVALRMLGALLILCSLPAIYHLGRLLFNGQTGRIALLMAALLPFQIFYAHEARQYALAVLCAAWLGVGLAALVRGKCYGAPLYIIAAVAGLYTHYYIGLLIAALHLWLVLYGPARRQWRRWLLADILIVVLFLPQIFIAAHQVQDVLSNFWIPPTNLPAPIATMAFLLFATTLPGGMLSLVAMVLIVCALAIAARDLFRKSNRRVRPYWLLGIVAVFGVLIPVQVYSLIRSPIYLDRSFGILSPFLLVMLAAGAVYARKPSPGPLLVGALIVLMVGMDVYAAVSPVNAKTPYREIAASLMARPDAATTLVLHVHDESFLPMEYYAPGLEQRLGDLQERAWLFPRTWVIFGIKRYSPAELDDWLRDYQGKLIIVESAFTDPPGQAFRAALINRACDSRKQVYSGATLYYLTLGPCLALRFP